MTDMIPSDLVLLALADEVGATVLLETVLGTVLLGIFGMVLEAMLGTALEATVLEAARETVAEAVALESVEDTALRTDAVVVVVVVVVLLDVVASVVVPAGAGSATTKRDVARAKAKAERKLVGCIVNIDARLKLEAKTVRIELFHRRPELYGVV